MSLETSDVPAPPPRFSLVLCTRGRQAEVGALLESLLRQAREDFELIVVDQNRDDRLVETLAQYSHRFPLRHIRSEESGAARARNVGLAYAKGELIGFPDDDCIYLDGYLDAVDRVFARNAGLGGLTGHPTTGRHPLDESSLGGGQDLGVFTVHNRCQEFTIFVRRDWLGSLRFNEHMGVGAPTPWGADEGPELLIRLMQTGCKMQYFPSLFVYHPDKVRTISRTALTRAASYARGRGCLLRLHRFPKTIVLNSLFRPAAGCSLYLLTLRPLRSAYYFSVFAGTLRGLLMSRSELASVAAQAGLETRR